MNFIANAAPIAALLSGISIFALFAALIARRQLSFHHTISRNTRAAHILLKRKLPTHPLWLTTVLLPSPIERQAALAGWKNQRLIAVLARAPMTAIALTLAVFAAIVSSKISIGKPALGLIAFTGIAIAVAPYLLIQKALRERRKAIANALPDTMELLAMVMRAGVGVEPGLRKTADSIAPLYPELAQELRIMLAELKLLPQREHAYQNLKQRTGSAGLSALVASLSQANQHGMPIAEAVSNAAVAMRAARLADAERRAASLPAKLAAPLVVFFLPAIFVVVLVPAILRFLGER